MITWKFKNTDVSYKSTPENLSRDIFKMAIANKIHHLTQVEYLNGTNDLNLATLPNSGNGNPSTISQSTIPVVSKKSKVSKSKADELPAVSGDVDHANIEFDYLEPIVTIDNLECTGDFDVDEPDGQNAH
jgi:hypothetical protein